MGRTIDSIYFESILFQVKQLLERASRFLEWRCEWVMRVGDASRRCDSGSDSILVVGDAILGVRCWHRVNNSVPKLMRC